MTRHGRSKGQESTGQGEEGGGAQKAPSPSGAQEKEAYASALFGESEAQREAFRVYLRAFQAAGEASEILYLSERATIAYVEGPSETREAARTSALEAAEEEWLQAFERLVRTQRAWAKAARPPQKDAAH